MGKENKGKDLTGELKKRLCGSNGANHFHIFWDCQAIRSY